MEKKSNPATANKRGFWNIKIPVYYSLIIVVILSGILYWQSRQNIIASEVKTGLVTNICPPPSIIRYSMSGFQYVHPLLMADNLQESSNLEILKARINTIIQLGLQNGKIKNASVYLRRINEGLWMSINDNEMYTPASLIKVPVMMTFLHDAERKPGLLNEQLLLSPEFLKNIPNQTFEGTALVAGQKYSIGFLLNRMVINSDNVATFLLNTRLNVPEFKKLFTELGMVEPDVTRPDYGINVSGYSKFLRVLYNATYLSNESSDFALKLLTEGDFKDGLLKNIPSELKVAHKFGEYGESKKGSFCQLHESGIFYLKDSPYILTIMTKGTDVHALPQVLAEISSEVYNELKSLNPL